MLLDITLPIAPKFSNESPENLKSALAGHIGTHFDVMDQTFPLEYTRRPGIAFDVSGIRDRDITAADIDLSRVEKGMFVAFYSHYIEEVGYGEKTYFTHHPQLSHELIEALVEKGVSIIALDFGGIRRAPEHVPKDRWCAERGTFVVENLLGLEPLTHLAGFTAHTYPMAYTGITGLPCRVLAEY